MYLLINLDKTGERKIKMRNIIFILIWSKYKQLEEKLQLFVILLSQTKIQCQCQCLPLPRQFEQPYHFGKDIKQVFTFLFCLSLFSCPNGCYFLNRKCRWCNDFAIVIIPIWVKIIYVKKYVSSSSSSPKVNYLTEDKIHDQNLPFLPILGFVIKNRD